MSALLSKEELTHYENLIYLPMVLTIFHKDRTLIDTLDFKLKAPYQHLIDQAIKCAEKDLRKSRIYLKKQDFKFFKDGQDDMFTKYLFIHRGYEDRRKYMNLRLRNRTEELMGVYLQQGMIENPHP